MVHGSGPLCRQILEQRSSHRHVDELDSAANPEDGDFALPCYREQGQLEEVSFPAGWAQERRGFGAVPRGVNVLTASEKETVHPLQRRAGEGRSHHG
jgi:hypothetical protein